MTPHKYPAVFPPQEQETIHDIVSKLQHYLEQKHSALQEKQRQCDQLSASLNAERAKNEAMRRERDALRAELEDERDGIAATQRSHTLMRVECERLRAEFAAERAAHEATKREAQSAVDTMAEMHETRIGILRAALYTARARADAAERMLGDAGVRDE